MSCLHSQLPPCCTVVFVLQIKFTSSLGDQRRWTFWLCVSCLDYIHRLVSTKRKLISVLMTNLWHSLESMQALFQSKSDPRAGVFDQSRSHLPNLFSKPGIGGNIFWCCNVVRNMNLLCASVALKDKDTLLFLP